MADKDKEYVYNRSKDLSAGGKVMIPEGAICVSIISGFMVYGRPNGERYAEWLQLV